MTKTPFAFLTHEGSIHTVLDEFALKSQSKQLEDKWKEAYGEHGLKAPLYNPETLARLAEINVYHYRSCRTKARDSAGLGWIIRPIGPDEPSNDGRARLEGWIENMSEPLTSTLEKAQYDFETTGFAAVEVIRENDAGDAEVVDLVHVQSYTIRIHFARNKFAQRRGARQVWFKRFGYPFDVHRESGTEHPLNSLDPELRANELLWWTNYTTRSDYYGLPDILPALGALQGDAARRDYNLEFFANYGIPAYAVWITGDFDPGEVDPVSGTTPLEDSIREVFAGMQGKPHSTLVMSLPSTSDGGKVEVTFEPLGTDSKEASFREYRTDNRDEILAAHGMPPYRIGIAETGSLGGSTAQESTIIYKTSVIEPRQTQLEQLLNNIIHESFGIFDWELKFAEIDTSDSELELNLMERLFKMAAVTPREIRAHFADLFSLDSDVSEDDEYSGMDGFYLNGTQIAPKQDVPEPLKPFADAATNPDDFPAPEEPEMEELLTEPTTKRSQPSIKWSTL